MIDPTVRPALPSDAPELRWIEAEARSALHDQRGGRRWLETHLPIDLGWESAALAAGAFVAHIDNVVVGYIRSLVHGPLATVDDVFVLEAARELGFGDELLATVIRWARTEGAQLIEGEALPGDRNTKNLYERAGIKARLITVSAEI